MAEKVKKNRTEGRKNLLYILWVVALAVILITTVVVVTALSAKKNNILQNNSDSGDTGTVNSASDSTDDSSSSDSGNSGDNQGDADDPNDDQQVSGTITFIMPIEGAALSKNYTDNTIVYSNTLGIYTGHMGIDFSAPAGTEVKCVFDGVIESVVTTYLTGTTVTVDHGNNLKTVYNSIEANDALYEGAKVKQGDLIGTVSDNNRQEYKDGAHLHFEVHKDGKKVNPEEYLIGNEK